MLPVHIEPGGNDGKEKRQRRVVKKIVKKVVKAPKAEKTPKADKTNLEKASTAPVRRVVPGDQPSAAREQSGEAFDLYV